MDKKTLRVTLVKSPAGTRGTHKATVLGLGLKKINQSRELEETAAELAAADFNCGGDART